MSSPGLSPTSLELFEELVFNNTDVNGDLITPPPRGLVSEADPMLSAAAALVPPPGKKTVQQQQPPMPQQQQQPLSPPPQPGNDDDGVAIAEGAAAAIEANATGGSSSGSGGCGEADSYTANWSLSPRSPLNPRAMEGDAATGEEAAVKPIFSLKSPGASTVSSKMTCQWNELSDRTEVSCGTVKRISSSIENCNTLVTAKLFEQLFFSRFSHQVLEMVKKASSVRRAFHAILQ